MATASAGVISEGVGRLIAGESGVLLANTPNATMASAGHTATGGRNSRNLLCTLLNTDRRIFPSRFKCEGFGISSLPAKQSPDEAGLFPELVHRPIADFRPSARTGSNKG